MKEKYWHISTHGKAHLVHDEHYICNRAVGITQTEDVPAGQLSGRIKCKNCVHILMKMIRLDEAPPSPQAVLQRIKS